MTGGRCPVAAKPLDEATSAAGLGRVYFPNLDGLRFVAFLLVYLQHGFGIGGLGGVGVAFFFVLSGFLITFLILTEIERTGQIDVGAFYVRRILRIWPLYYAVLFYCFIVYPVSKQVLGLPPTLQAGNPLWYAFFLSNFDVIRSGGTEGAMSTNVTWSVAIEEQFYLTWPLLFRFVPVRRQLLLFLGIIGGSVAFRLAHASTPPVLYFHSLSVISDMAIGGLAAYSWRRSAKFRSSVVALPRLFIGAVYCVGGTMLGLSYLGIGSFFNPLERIVVAFLFAFIVLEQNFSRASFFKMVQFRWVTLFGRYTYGLYLLHAIVVTLLGRALFVARVDAYGGWGRLVLGPVGLGLSIALAALSYHGFEKPFLDLKSRFTHVRSGGP